jgi:hypothetical protein
MKWPEDQLSKIVISAGTTHLSLQIEDVSI